MSGIRAFFRLLRIAPRAQKRNFLIAQIGVVVMAIAQLMVPQLIREIIDDGIIAGDLDSVVSTSLVIMLWSIANLAVASLVAYLSASTATNLAHAVRIRLYDKVTNLSFGNLDRLSTGNLLVRLTSDVNNMKNAWMMTMFMLFQAPWLLMGAVTLVWIQTPELLWIMAAVLAVTTVFVIVAAPALGPMYAKAQAQLDRLNTIFQENIAGIRVVKAFNRDGLESERFAEQNNAVYEAQLRPAFRIAVFQPALFGLLYAAVGAAVLVAGPEVADGVITRDPAAVTAGELATFFNYLLTAMIPIMIVVLVIPELGKFEASMQRAIQVFDTEPDIVQPSDPIDPGVLAGRIEFRNVTMSYLNEEGEPAGRPVLSNVSFVIEPGETVAILGQTGSGKTSLINLIPRFYDVTDGEVLVDGHDVRKLDLVSLRSQIGVAQQRAVLFSGTIDENLRYGEPHAEASDIEAAARVADAHSFITAQVDGYGATVAEQGKNLSGGQRQRVSLARAVASNPRILILDDTTSAVDVATEARIQASLAGTMGDRTVIMVAQRVSTAIGADKIVVLDSGEIAEIGAHSELVDRSELYREIVESQLGPLEEIAELLEES